MKREEIEKAVTRLGGLDYFKKDIIDFAIEQINAALEEARVEISEAQDIESAMNIVDQLKIK